MNRVKSCAGCGHGLVPLLSAKGSRSSAAGGAKRIEARTVDMAKWADSPIGKPERIIRRPFE